MARPRAPAATSSDGSRQYDPRKDPKIILLAVVVFGTLAIGIAGVGSTPVGGGGDGTVFPLEDWRDDGPEEVALSMDVNRTTLRPGQTVAVSVAYENGTPASEATVSVDGTNYRLDEEGRTTITFDGGGQFTATARQEGDESVRYVADGEIISVERWEIPLAVSANRTDVTAGDDVEFTVRRADTNDPVSANVELAGETYATDDRGRATVRIPRAGTFEATGTKSVSATRRYSSDAVVVSASRRHVSLAVAVNSSDPRPGDSVRLSLFRTDTGETVEGEISVGDRSMRTVDGAVTVRLDRAGQFDLRASTSDTETETFDPVDQTLSVPRHVAPVALSANRTSVESGETVRFTAVRTDTGQRLAGQLAVGNRTYWLDGDGTATVRFDDPGDVRVAARRANTTTHRFPASELSVAVADTEYRIATLEAPDSVERDAEATVGATVENVGTDAGTPTVVYRFDGEVVAERSISLADGATREVQFSVPSDVEPGEYRHEVSVRGDSVGARIEISSGDESS